MCNAMLRLDRSSGVLHVKGTQQALAEVERQLSMLTGPRIDITPVLWAELMRTRTSTDVAEGAVARIQHLTGCRVHIERSCLQVQLLGPNESTTLAEHFLRQVQGMCSEEIVEDDLAGTFSSDMILDFAEEWAVSMVIEDRCIRIMGICNAVSNAAQDLRKILHQDCKMAPTEKTLHNQHIVERALSQLNVNVNCETYISPQRNAYHVDGPDKVLYGAVLAKIPPTAADAQAELAAQGNRMSTKFTHGCQTCGCSAKFCVKCGQSVQDTAYCSGAGCETCGILKFCMFCGCKTAKHVDTTTDAFDSTVSLNKLNHAPVVDKAMTMKMVAQQYSMYAAQQQTQTGFSVTSPFMVSAQYAMHDYNPPQMAY